MAGADQPTGTPVTTRAFAALQVAGYRAHLATFVLTMMADNIEHVISYWMLYRRFHSPALGGFAVLSHWLPYLFFAVPAGALADHFDPRRIIQVGGVMFMGVSLAWGWFFHHGDLQMWQAMVLLVIHGFAGVLWTTSSQVLVHDIVPPVLLQSAVRGLATGRYLGILAGPAVGAGMMLLLGPQTGIVVNALYYLPLLLWLWKAPYGPRFRQDRPAARRAVRGFADIVQTMRDVAHEPVIVSMTVLGGIASFFVGNSYQAQMPGFAQDLGHGDPGVLYSMLLAADAAGALVAGVLLEATGLLRPGPRAALGLACLWCMALAGFALAGSYLLALLLLFLGGFFELSFSSMAQALVQLRAQAEIRGRVIGLYSMSAQGLRAFSGITVGVAGSLVGVHWSLAGAALATLLLTGSLWLRQRKLPGTP